MVNFVWLEIGTRTVRRVRSDQIATWYDDYMNGHQHYIHCTLLSGEKISGEVTREQWDTFKAAM